MTFLQNHREVIAAFDFLPVPTVSFQLLYCFFVIEHARRRIPHFHVTRHPTADWVVQQLCEALPEAGPYRYVIFDRDSTFHDAVVTFLKATGLQPHEPHLRRLIREYINYYHEDRIHDSLEKDTPNRRSVEQKSAANASVTSSPRLDGLHHRYS